MKARLGPMLLLALGLLGIVEAQIITSQDVLNLDEGDLEMILNSLEENLPPALPLHREKRRLLDFGGFGDPSPAAGTGTVPNNPSGDQLGTPTLEDLLEDLQEHIAKGFYPLSYWRYQSWL